MSHAVSGIHLYCNYVFLTFLKFRFNMESFILRVISGSPTTGPLSQFTCEMPLTADTNHDTGL